MLRSETNIVLSGVGADPEFERKLQVVDSIASLHAALFRAIFSANPKVWIDLDLTMQQLKVLFVLHVHGSHTVTALAERFGVRLPTITGVVDRLVEHGLARRDADRDDRRVVLVQLTPAGQSQVGELHAANRTTLLRLLPDLTVDELIALEHGLAALKRAYEREAARLTERVAERVPTRLETPVGMSHVGG